jgi:nucleoredoxin
MNKKGKKFEVVWVSRDNSEDAFVQYYQKMPWLAVTIENIPKCVEKTSTKYQVRGIPHLVVLDGYDATVYTLDGRGKVAQDPYGLEFPWRPRTPGMLLKRILPSSVRTLVTGQLAAAKGRIVTFLRGVLESFLPPSLVSKLVGR